MFIRVRGANVNFRDDGTFHSILDAAALVFLTDLFSAHVDTDLRYIRGGDAAYVAAGGGDTTLPPAIAEALDR